MHQNGKSLTAVRWSNMLSNSNFMLVTLESKQTEHYLISGFLITLLSLV